MSTPWMSRNGLLLIIRLLLYLCSGTSFADESVALLKNYDCNYTAEWRREDGTLQPCSCPKVKYHIVLCPCEEHKDTVIACDPSQRPESLDCVQYEQGLKECASRRGSASMPASVVVPPDGHDATAPEFNSNATLPTLEASVNGVPVVTSKPPQLASGSSGPSTLGNAENAGKTLAIGTVVLIVVGVTVACLVIAVFLWKHRKSSAQNVNGKGTSNAGLHRNGECSSTTADDDSEVGLLHSKPSLQLERFESAVSAV